jgi:hypothetical protein
MSYPLLYNGNKIPAVGVAQKLLNARAGSSLVADGDFGSKTKAAVKEFQRPRGLVVDGVIGQNTWGRLKQMADKLQIIDCVDVFDPSLNDLEAKDIVKAGGNPILIGGMSNGVEQAITEILGTAAPGEVFLLRFHGHGNSGIAGISHGQGGKFFFHARRQIRTNKFPASAREAVCRFQTERSRSPTSDDLICASELCSKWRKILRKTAESYFSKTKAYRFSRPGRRFR